MNVAACDDQEAGLAKVEEVLFAMEEIESVEGFLDIDAFMKKCRDGNQYDIVFMDIDWRIDKNGIDYAEELYGICPDTKIVFVTGYAKQYIEAVFMKNTNIAGYLAKPVKEDKVSALLQKIRQRQVSEQAQRLVIKQRGSVWTLPYKQIYFIESVLHHIRIYTAENVVELYATMSETYEKLPPNFCRCHKSYVVNMDYIRRIDKEGVLMEAYEKPVPISRLKARDVLERYMTYVGEKLG